MHPRNPYQTSPDFSELGEQYPALQPHLISTATGTSIDFHDAKAQRCLTQALLHRDFGLEIYIPDDRLCPPVPNRLNYILWLQDIVAASQVVSSADPKPIIGIDIGTGASAIYPLLGCASRKDWRFIATDIDPHSLQHASNNVQQNDLENRIRVVQVAAGGPIFATSLFEIYDHVDFTMCNPPFYSDREEVLRSAEAKELGPNGVCTGADTEMITPGGEVTFVRRMVEESLTLRTRCRWYTSMVGKMSSLTDVVELLRDKQVENYAITEFVQGKTRRWAIAWSFTDERLPDLCARIPNPALHSIMPPRNTLKQPFSGVSSASEIFGALMLVLPVVDGVAFDTVYTEDESDVRRPLQVVVCASGNTWSRASRRKKLVGTPAQSTEGVAPALTCRITALHVEDTASEQFLLEFQWLRGESRALFESFMAHVSRKVETALRSSVDGMVS